MTSTTPTIDGATIVLVGHNGRVGAVLHEVFGRANSVRTIGRFEIDRPQQFRDELVDALRDADVVINAAGVAHLERARASNDIARLLNANALLPLELAEACHRAATPFVHISSSKAATLGAKPTAYAWSKRVGDDLVIARCGEPFRASGNSVVIIRPPAMLFPPFHAGKLRWFRSARILPERLTPSIPMPVLAPDRLIVKIDFLVRGLRAGEIPPGVSIVDFGRDETGTLRTIRSAMLNSQADTG